MKNIATFILLGLLAASVFGGEFDSEDKHLFKKLNQTLNAYDDKISYYRGQINETNQIIEVLTPFMTNKTFALQQFQTQYNTYQLFDGQQQFSPRDVGALLYSLQNIYKINAFPRDTNVLPGIFNFYDTDSTGQINLQEFNYADYSLYTEFYGQKYRQLDQLNQNLTQTINDRQRYSKFIKFIIKEALNNLDE